jgi:hypothetical protein
MECIQRDLASRPFPDNRKEAERQRTQRILGMGRAGEILGYQDVVRLDAEEAEQRRKHAVVFRERGNPAREQGHG